MCWNAEVSLQSFLIGITAIFFAYQKGLSLPTTIFSVSIVSMQLVEFFIWTYYGNKTINLLGSLTAAFLIWIQPIASMLTLSKDIQTPSIVLYSVLTAISLLLDKKPLKEKYKMERAPNGHLSWGFINKDRTNYFSILVYLAFVFLPLILSNHWELILIVLITLGISMYNFWESNTWGSMWCWVINYLVVGVCIYRIFNPKV